MEETKQWWQSKTMWAGIVTFVVGVLGATGLADMEGQQNVIVEKVMQIVTALGSLIILYGRVTAKSMIVKKPPGTTAGVLLLCSILIAGGCMWPHNPKADLLASQKTFSATVDSLTTLNHAGKFTPEETDQLTVLIHEGQDYLIAWEDALKAGNEQPDAIALFQAVLDKLLEYNLAKGGE